MIKVFTSKKSKTHYLVSLNADGTLLVTDLDGNQNPNAGSLIRVHGGIDTFLGECRDYDMTALEFKEMKERERKESVEREAVIRQKKDEQRRLSAEKLFNELKERSGAVIETTPENLEIVMNYLNSMNWGSWILPKMSIGYAACQHDCGGKTVTTVTLDKPLGGETKFKTDCPFHYLEKYVPIGRFD